MSTHSASAPQGSEASLDFNAGSSWRPVDLERYADGKVAPPDRLARSDGRCLLYQGKAHSFIGDSEAMKSWAAILACRDFFDHDETALYIDCESDPLSMLNRFRNVGVPLDTILSLLVYIRPDEPLRRGGALEAFDEASAFFRPALVVIDGATEFYAMNGLDVNDAVHAARAQAMVLRRWPGDMTTLEIDHVGKAVGATALGSQHKRAGIDGASYRFTLKDRGGLGGVSTSSVELAKDREGMVVPIADGKKIGLLRLDSSATPWDLSIVSPGDQVTANEARAASEESALDDRVLGMIPNGVDTTGAIRSVVGNARKADASIKRLVAAGSIERDPDVRKNPPWVVAVPDQRDGGGSVV